MNRTVHLQAVDPMTGAALGDVVSYVEPDPLPDTAEFPVATRPDPTPYPEKGTVADVLAWVDDPACPDAVRSDRAKAAIAAEHDRGTPRTTLLAELDERTGR